MKDLGIRALSGVIGIALLIFIIKLGGNVLNISLLIVSLIGLYEFFNAIEKKGYKPLKILAYIITIIYYLLGRDYLGVIITLSIMSLMLTLLTQKYKIEDISLTLLSLGYIPFLFSHIALLDNTDYIWLVFIIAFGTDTFAYFAGNLFGKNKLCPNISPNKTVEGFIGGILGSLFLTFLYAKFIKIDNIIILLPLALIGSIISQSGDLVASSMKRYVEVKDYGNLIPGHGGILDRFDSIIFTAPIVYYYMEIILT